jgi:23S rRNA (cytidine1920-2'-O)/16S rRNA (cytidine1409-2'-O)-methyltransferase
VPGNSKTRLDVLLVERGLAPTRQRAQGLILAGAVTVDGKPANKAGMSVASDAGIEVVNPEEEYVSRGALKLAEAIEQFDIVPAGKVAVDVGASTGGFTDVLLRHGARRVYAVDVGYGQLAWTLRQDPRVVVMERTNFRYVEALPEPIDLAVADVSFISLRLLMPSLTRVTSAYAEAVLLIKPQFEAGREKVGKGGVVRDPAVHREAIVSVISAAREHGWSPVQLAPSPILGPSGNREFLAHLVKGGESDADLEGLADLAVG